MWMIKFIYYSIIITYQLKIKFLSFYLIFNSVLISLYKLFKAFKIYFILKKENIMMEVNL